MEWVESTGASIDEAKERALDRLGVHEDDAEFEVVADVRTGLFGRVKEEARVRARVAPSTPPAKDDRRNRNRKGRKRGARGKGEGQSGGQAGAESRGGGPRKGGGADKKGGRSGGGQGQKNRASSGDRRAERASSPETPADTTSAASGGGRQEKESMNDETTMPLPEQADLAEDFVRGLAEQFGTTVSFERTQVDEDEIRIIVSGDDLGRMVGRRGTTAAAIDDLVRTVLQRQAGSSRNGRIRVDVGGVRARRAEALAAFALSQAAEVRSSGTARALEPMSAADRKVVHDALVDEDGIETVSEGEDAQRRVVIVPAASGD